MTDDRLKKKKETNKQNRNRNQDRKWRTLPCFSMAAITTTNLAALKNRKTK